MALSTIFQSCQTISQRQRNREEKNKIDEKKATNPDLVSHELKTCLPKANNCRASLLIQFQQDCVPPAIMVLHKDLNYYKNLSWV